MEHYQLLNMTHAALAILLTLGLIAHIIMLWKAWRRADPVVLQNKLRRTRLMSLPLLAVFALLLPVTGWWLAHLAGLPLGQLWLLASSVLFLVLVPLGLLLGGRLRAWQALGDTPAPAALPRFALVYAGLILLILVAIMGLMGAKPV
ncbi:DUF2269 family protein [Stutzerimonas xanthomarina]|uniref:Uncharacterized membrane protein n=2 Tax=Stutzerimonas xanthomarina TaxID=271420 RepID=A0A1M5SZC4_9GAMM|nr:DUF2269 family protein [Stutzerimonas xanthomarina]MCP9339878.1 DUF2269 domain-containing protein [Stutzerimonas xanthomarina]SEH57801.1 Uncharacterized membrane protein [Stutzerimonas xanthomarina]SHH43678.1 Uncharacterized membrane protein [Stutzerimonas xanthomarina DSM 18231]